MEVKVRNKKWDEERFLRERKEVLSTWPTGKEVNFEEAVEYQKRLPDHKNFMKVADELHRKGKTVVFPRAGTPILEQEIELNQTLVKAGLPLIPVTPDSYCRRGDFRKAQQGLEESIRLGRPMLNGYPTVIHGVKNTRKVVENTEAALNQRLTNVGGVRLMAEIAFASGMTAALVDPLLTFVCYEKNFTSAECIEHYQYIWRLVAYYAERGIIITVDFDGPEPVNLQFPAGVRIASIIVDALLAAKQGVKSIMPRVGIYGNMLQDIAWTRVERRLVREYLDKFGFRDVVIPGIFLDQTPLFPYPQDIAWCFAFLNYSAMVAALAEATAAYVRTFDEGAGIPSKETHAMSYRSAKWIFDVVRTQKIELDNEELRNEEKITEMETRSLVEKILELGDGDAAIGYEKAVQGGAIDFPLPTNRNCKGEVLGIRDLKGACRFLEFGNLAIPEEAKEFHREKVAERERIEGRKMDLSVVIEDFWAFSKGRIKGEAVLSKHSV
jgi:methylaspartate mutase epsilon subunit